MRLKNERGVIPVDMLIIIIILILSFVIIFLFLRGFSSITAIDKNACRQSVVYRSTFKSGPLEGGAVIPLQCKTEKICLTVSGSDCKEISSTKDNPVKKIQLSKDRLKAKEEILDTLAESMRECHWMLGEGQLNFMPKDWITPSIIRKSQNYGLICTRFVFDDEAKRLIESISYGELYGHLEKKQTTQGISYLEYLNPGWKRSEDALTLFAAAKTQGVGSNTFKEKFLTINDPKDWKINLNSEGGYAIIAQIAPHNQGETSLLAAGTAISIPVAAAFIASGIGAPIGITIVGLEIAGVTGIATGSAILWYNHDDKYDYAPPAIYPFDVNWLKSINVASFEVAP